MSGNREVAYALDFRAGTKGRRRETKTDSPDRVAPDCETADAPVPRIARLLALAIRFDELLREDTIRNYADLARLGGVTRARMTQIMKLLHLAPDIQERILFPPVVPGLNERNLRPVVARIDWDEQRRLFRKFTKL